MATLFDEQIAAEKVSSFEAYQRWVEKHTRPSHPKTSVEGAEHIAKKITGAMGLALDMLESYPGRTAAELDAIAGHGGGTIRKRLSDLRALGLARVTGKKKCSKTGRNAQTWGPA